jgi:acetyl esterase/lipase
MRKLCFLAVLLNYVCLAQNAAPNTVALPDGVSVESNLSYGRFPETVMDVYQSQKSAASERRPGVIVFHGGGWIGGSKESTIEKFVIPYLEHGFVVANVEYRLAGVAPAPAAVSDALEAASWFRNNAHRWNVDPKRIVATGESAGGHLALMVGMTPKSAHLGPVRKVAAVINFYGITDVEDQLQGEHTRDYASKWIPEQKGRYELARRLSPLTEVRKKNVPPILSIHGNADEVVPYDHSIELTRTLRNVHADAEMIAVPNGGHGFPLDKMSQIYPQIFEFLRRRRILK